MIEWQVPELPMTLRLQARGRYLVQIAYPFFLSHHDCLVSHTRCTKTHSLQQESAKRRDGRLLLSTPSKPRRKMQSPGQPLARWQIALSVSLLRALGALEARRLRGKRVLATGRRCVMGMMVWWWTHGVVARVDG
jgi:hypothetical protein